MKAFIFFALAIGLVLSSPCTDKKPAKANDCVSIYDKNSMCCMLEVQLNNETTRTCVEKPITQSGKDEYEKTLFKGNTKITSLTCSIPIELCGPKTADISSECYSVKLPNGRCCYDPQGVCFSYPFHFTKEGLICDGSSGGSTTKPPKKVTFPFLDDD